jgi:tRNA pseudouridine55 synthase
MNGVINVLKPPAMSSNGVTVYLKKLLNEKRVGHAGTLDPGAAGVLVVLLGRTARLSDYLMGHDKIYLAEMHFGCTTDTLDSYGTVLETRMPVRKITLEGVRRACAAFVGQITQMPPAYSAIKVNGRKSYELARKGINIPKPPRNVQIYAIEVLEQTGPLQFLLRICCSKGTYVRTLVEDIAASMGELAYTSLLVREKSGDYDIQHAYTLDEIAEMAQAGDFSFCISPERVVEKLPAVHLGREQRFAIEHGQLLTADYPIPSGQFALYCDNVFYGIGIEEGGHPKLKIPLY